MKTIDLIDKAQATGASMREWSKRLGLSPNALSRARNEGRLSPALAATLAAELGEDVGRWTLQAVAENERSAPMRQRLGALMRAKSYFCRMLATARRTVAAGLPTACPT